MPLGRLEAVLEGAVIKRRVLGYWAARFLLDGGTEAMVSIHGGRLVPMAFRELLDPGAGRVRVRYADVTSEAYRTLAAYMTRLAREDLADPERLKALADAARLQDGEFLARVGPLVASA